MTSGSRLGAGSLRRLPFADIMRRRTIERAVFPLRQSRVFRVRLRTVANMLPVGSVVPMCLRRSAGKWWKAGSPSRSLTGLSNAFSYFTPWFPTKRSKAALASSFVSAIRISRPVRKGR